MQKSTFLFPSMRSLPSPKAHSGSFFLPVTLYDLLFFLLSYRILVIFNEYIENHISPHDLREGRGGGSRDLFAEWFGTGKMTSTISEADEFFLLFSHSIKAGQDQFLLRSTLTFLHRSTGSAEEPRKQGTITHLHCQILLRPSTPS